MTLTEIIAEIDEKYPNSVSSASKVRKMSILQKRLYRKMGKQTFASYGTVTNQPSYPITQNIDDIFDILVGSSVTNKFHSYPRKMLKDTTWGSETCGRWYTFFGDVTTGDYIDIHPTPDNSVDTYVIWYYEEPADLDPDTLNSTPPLDHDYHMLFVYHVCKEIAENYRDFDIATGYAQQFNELYLEMASTFQNPEVILVHSESGW
jgi:hypothetical protein